MSGDFRRHSVAYFIEPVLARHDPDAVEVDRYYNASLADEVTERIASLAGHWLVVRGLDDEALAERIRADGIDILIDLAGHSAGNRLSMFALKPAPIQITWIGYLGTTGMSSIDYRLTDPIADPPGTGAEAHSETLLRVSALLRLLPPAGGRAGRGRAPGTDSRRGHFRLVQHSGQAQQGGVFALGADPERPARLAAAAQGPRP